MPLIHRARSNTWNILHTAALGDETFLRLAQAGPEIKIQITQDDMSATMVMQPGTIDS